MRKFLYTIVILIVLVAAALFALRMYSRELTEIAMVPGGEFVEQEDLGDNSYADPAMWFSRPGLAANADAARWQPQFSEDRTALPPPAEEMMQPRVNGEIAPRSPAQTAAAADPASAPAPGPPPFAVFFVHPTSYFDPRAWNAPLDDEQSQQLARVFVQGMGSAFNQASEIWAPRYRQATFGTFLTDISPAQSALDAAYADVAHAFDFFIANVDPDMPIVLAGHSQGSLHVLRLLREKVAGTPLESRIAAAYPIGWPISLAHDLPALPLPACAAPGQAHCLVTWSSFAEPADPAMMLEDWEASAGFDGQQRGSGPILCVNPLTGSTNGSAPATANLGTLVPNADLTSGELVRGAVAARCNAQGLLLIGDPPELGPGVMPFNNYHVYDIPLFWRNLQLDVVRRVEAWQPAA